MINSANTSARFSITLNDLDSPFEGQSRNRDVELQEITLQNLKLLKEKMERARNAYKAQVKKLSTIQDQNQFLISQNSCIQNKLKDRQKQLQKSAKENKAIQKQLDKLREENQTLKQNLDTFKRGIMNNQRNSTERISFLEKEQKKKFDEAAHFKEELDQARRQLSEQGLQLMQTQGREKDCNLRLKKMEEENFKKQDLVDQLRKSLAEQAKELTLQKQNQQIRISQISQLERETYKMRSQMKMLQIRQVDSTKLMKGKELESDRLKEQIEKMMEDLREGRRHIEQLQNDNQELKERNQNYQHRIEEFKIMQQKSQLLEQSKRGLHQQRMKEWQSVESTLQSIFEKIRA